MTDITPEEKPRKKSAEKKKTGRPRLITDEKKDLVIAWIKEALVSRPDCAKRLGVELSTFNNELARDPIFLDRVKQAEAEARDKLVKAVINHGTAKDYRAMWSLLQSKWAAEFSRKPGMFSLEDFQAFALKLSDLVRKYVPDHQHIAFADEVSAIIKEMEREKKKAEYIG